MGIYIFDFDGTLGDSMPSFAKKMLEILREHHVEYSEEIIKIITPLGYKGTAKYFIQEFGLPYTVDELIAKMHEVLYPVYRDEIVLKPTVADYLKKKKNEGHSLNVLTASPFRVVEPVLKRGGVFDLFDHVWSCEDFNMTKDNPQIYYEAAARAGGKPEDVIFFDDNVEAIRTAVSAGIYTVGVYDDASLDYLEEIKAVANKFIYGFDEMD